MANFTRKAIFDSFYHLLTEHPLSQITVKDIVSDCGINRNTFYYYFEDIPKLVEEMFLEEADKIICAYPAVERYEDCLEAFISAALSKKRALLHIYHSADRDIYEQCVCKVCDHVIDAYVTTLLRGRKIRDQDLTILREYLSSLFFGFVANWMRAGMPEDIRGKFARLCEIQKGMVEEMFDRCAVQ